MPSLPEKITTMHLALKSQKIPYGFGGALALAWCTERARGTIDIDLNIFISNDEARSALDALPTAVKWTEENLAELTREGQIRLWWEKTPIDIFLNTTKLHSVMARRCRWEMFAGESVPFLSCQDIAILKVFFNRTKDWADIEEMYAAGTLDTNSVMATVIEYLGADDERVKRLTSVKETFDVGDK